MQKYCLIVILFSNTDYAYQNASHLAINTTSSINLAYHRQIQQRLDSQKIGGENKFCVISRAHRHGLDEINKLARVGAWSFNFCALILCFDSFLKAGDVENSIN
jgi:hypothetical protein